MQYRLILWVAVLSGAALSALAQTAPEFNAQGVAQYQAGHWDEAIRVFERAYDLAPDNGTVRRNLCNAHQAAANALAKEADFAAAVKHLELATSVDAENASPLIQLGSYYLRLEFVAEAIARLEEAIDLSPRNVDAHDLLGDAYYLDNDVPSALTQWKWVAEVQPNRPGLRQKMEKASREEAVESNFRPTGSRHFQLTYSPEIAGRSLRRVLNTLEHAYVEIGRNFSAVYPPTPIQVIVYNAQGFSDATQAGSHIGGLYDGKIRIPLLNAEGKELDDGELKQRLFHEYTHVVVRFLAGSHAPWWLNEGLAESFSNEMSPARREMLRSALEKDALFPLAGIEESQMEKLSETALRLAYAQSHATVRYLLSKFGQRRLTNLMSALAEGTSAEDALQQNYGRTYAQLQKEVARTFSEAT